MARLKRLNSHSI